MEEQSPAAKEEERKAVCISSNRYQTFTGAKKNKNIFRESKDKATQIAGEEDMIKLSTLDNAVD